MAEADRLLTAPGSPFEIAEANIRGVRTRVWKYIRYPHGDGKPDRHMAELYNIKTDPEERRNLIRDPQNQFAANASSLTLVGSLFVLITALALLLTIENALNQLWGVKKNRPFLKRVGLYVLMLALGPPVLGSSLWATSYVLGESVGLLKSLPPSAHFVLNLGPLLLGTVVLAGVFYLVPNANVRKRHAIVGGFIAGGGFELGKRAFAAWLLKVPTYKAVYGAFAVVPVFLLWVYLSWLVTLLAALITANLGRQSAPAARRR